MPDIDDLIEDLHDDDPFVVATRILDTLDVHGEAREALLPVVVFYVANRHRGRTRGVEQRAVELVGGFTNAHARAMLTHESFAIAPGKWVRWGEATIEQHEQRIAFLIAKRHGIDRTIDRHREAIEAIRAAGVVCLDDIPAGAA